MKVESESTSEQLVIDFSWKLSASASESNKSPLIASKKRSLEQFAFIALSVLFSSTQSAFCAKWMQQELLTGKFEAQLNREIKIYARWQLRVSLQSTILCLEQTKT